MIDEFFVTVENITHISYLRLFSTGRKLQTFLMSYTVTSCYSKAWTLHKRGILSSTDSKIQTERSTYDIMKPIFKVYLKLLLLTVYEHVTLL